MTAGEMFGIAAVSIAFLAVLVAVGAAVCLVIIGGVEDDDDEEEDNEK